MEYETIDLEAAARNSYEHRVKKYLPHACDGCVRAIVDDIEALMERGEWGGLPQGLHDNFDLPQPLPCGCCDHSDPTMEHARPLLSSWITAGKHDISVCKQCGEEVDW